MEPGAALKEVDVAGGVEKERLLRAGDSAGVFRAGVADAVAGAGVAD